MVAAEKRLEYVQALWNYQCAVGCLTRGGELLPPHPTLAHIREFLESQWRRSLGLVEEARARQRTRP